MDSNSSFRIHRTYASFQSFKIHEFRDKKRFNAFQVDFSEFNNKLVAAFTTNGVGNSVSFHCLTFFFLLWMLKNTFTTFPVSFQVFWCLEHTTNCFIFSKSGLKYPKLLQSLLSVNQVNIWTKKLSLQCKILQSIWTTLDFNSLH